MKARTVLAVAVCIACFLLGYMAYAGTMFFVDFFAGRIDPCHSRLEVCSQEEMVRKPN